MIERHSPRFDTYYHLLSHLHQERSPRTYLEIGVHEGHSLNLVHPATLVIGIDPEPKIEHPLPPTFEIITATSDDYFESLDGQSPFGELPIDMAFVDGMHHVEFALRDFMNLERLASPDSTILVHDCRPIDELTACRDRSTVVWSGDIWKLIPFLNQHRPDLDIVVHDVEPTGLAEISNLDPANTTLAAGYDSWIADLIAMPFSQYSAAD
ncbi:MAG: class I SAM-dependent methyltransferase [Acidimicrobiales bacterium]